MKYYITIIAIIFTQLLISQNDDLNVKLSEDVNVNLALEEVERPPLFGIFKAAKNKDWKAKRTKYLQEYTFKPSKKSANNLFKANRKLGLPWDSDILEEHVLEWIPEIDLSSKVEVISKDEAIKQIQAAKKLLDDGILSPVEYEMISNKLKPIIID